jgi:hypothetical protein
MKILQLPGRNFRIENVTGKWQEVMTLSAFKRFPLPQNRK